MKLYIENIACVGAGVIGASWATNFILKGYPVALFDINDEFLAAARERIRLNLEFLQECGAIDTSKLRNSLDLISFTTKIKDAVAGAQFIQESGPENYAAKQKIIGEVEKFADKSAIIASSTSGLLISEIAKYALRPERCLGAHPYNPPHLIPLVEITRGEKTTEEFLQAAWTFYRALGKEPVILQKECLGFIANRLQTALYREAVDLVCRGVCSLEDVDKACLYGPGIRYAILGPNLIFQLGGGEAGIQGMMKNLVGPSFECWLPDMAKWEKLPDGWPLLAQKGVAAAMENRAADQGRTNVDLIRFRDRMLVNILKLHGKI